MSLIAQMSSSPLPYIEYADGASCHTRHIASAAWFLYTTQSELLSSGGVFLGSTTNNISKYMSMIKLLTEASSQGISNLVVRLDSQLIVMQFTNHYHIHNPILLHYFLRV